MCGPNEHGRAIYNTRRVIISHLKRRPPRNTTKQVVVDSHVKPNVDEADGAVGERESCNVPHLYHPTVDRSAPSCDNFPRWINPQATFQSIEHPTAGRPGGQQVDTPDFVLEV
eukprot:5285354-Pyramimonas_sp.AAC.2